MANKKKPQGDAKGKVKPAGAAKRAFQKAVEATPDISSGYKAGLQALEKAHKAMIVMADSLACQGSVSIDACCAKQPRYAQANRWDYAIAYDGAVYFAEPHTAGDHGVSKVLRKLQWLKDWLQAEAPELKKLLAKQQPYTWLQSDRFSITPASPCYRRAAAKGILPGKRLVLPPQ